MADLFAWAVTHGGWGVSAVVVSWVVWMQSTGRWISPREYDAWRNQQEQRLADVKERLAAEAQEKEWWREIASQGAELGTLLAKTKIGRRREVDDA